LRVQREYLVKMKKPARYEAYVGRITVGPSNKPEFIIYAKAIGLSLLTVAAVPRSLLYPA
jgi:hypothetical protein